MKNKILTITLNPAIDFTIEVPNFNTNKVNKAISSRRDPGGKGINVATALSKKNYEVHVSGFIGKGNSDIFTEHFKKCGIKDNFIYVNGNTREGIKIADTLKEITTDINFIGFELHQKEIESFLQKYKQIISNFDYVIISGSLPKNVNTNIYCELAKIAKENGVFVAIDTSGESLLSCINCGYINLIKPNIEELSEIYPEIDISEHNEESIDNLALKLLGKVEMIALSLGDRGSRLYTKNGVFKANAPKINVKSSVGAGDAFLAGFLSGLIKNEPYNDVLRTATSWAASKLLIYGPGLSDEKPPKDFVDDITVVKLQI